MTAPEPGPLELWCARLAGTLADAAAKIGALAGAVAADWPDDLGREWVERAALVHRELDRDALAAAQVGARLATERELTASDTLTGMAAALATAGRRSAQLGGTEAHRADQERGMRIAQLPDS